MERRFYVTMVRGAKVAWLAGPFASEPEAREHIPHARRVAGDVDPRSAFDAFGTASREAEHHPPGVLNKLMNLD